MPIVIIDYEMGNLRSVQKGFERAGFESIITRDRKKIEQAKGLVFPGVGSFDAAIINLKKFKLIETLKEQIFSEKPFMGICLGMQLLFEKSEEGKLSGLSMLKGNVKKFRGENLKVPQIGWNQISLPACRAGRQLTAHGPALPAGRSQLFKKIPDNSYFYFVHSYYVVPKDKSIISSTTDYGVDFASSIQKDNIFGVQFHPEKSSGPGIQILKNFGELCLK